MRQQEKWAPLGGLIGALVGLAITVAAACSPAPLSAGILVVAIVGLTPALAGLGVILAIDAAPLFGLLRTPVTPRLTVDVEEAARERFQPRPQAGGIRKTTP